MTDADVDRVTELFALAFYDDPTWSWAFPDPERRMDQHRLLWGPVSTQCAPARVGVDDRRWWRRVAVDPPGEFELSEADEASLERLVRELVGSHADAVLALFERFDANHPRYEPHFYLSLLATHPEHRGRGKGMGVLAANLAAIDELRLPSYLESSNRANDRRYERLGFVEIGEFAAPGDGPTIGCMWRDSR